MSAGTSRQRAGRVLLFVGSDLMARSRLESAAAARSFDVETVAVPRLLEALRARPPDVVVVDLDAGGEAALELLSQARSEAIAPRRVLGFFAHVDEDLGGRATAAGVEAYTRGRFWRTLPDVLEG